MDPASVMARLLGATRRALYPAICASERGTRGPRRRAWMTSNDRMASSNPFIAPDVAKRYASGRPYHHRRTLERCLALCQRAPDGPALDVACGTGLSTRALAEVGFQVAGVDVTPGMVAVASEQAGLPFVVAEAESLPVAGGSVGLLTVASGLHWFDRSRFFSEAVRVLAPAGALLIYEHAGVGVANDQRFSAWIDHVYLSHFPSPPTPAWLAAVDPPAALRKVAAEAWEDIVRFSHEEVVAYLLTQGNVSTRIDDGEIAVAEAREWLLRETAPFFVESSQRDFSFMVMADLFVANQ